MARLTEIIKIGDQEKRRAEWLKIYGVSHQLYRQRIMNGATPEEALTSKILKKTDKRIPFVAGQQGVWFLLEEVEADGIYRKVKARCSCGNEEVITFPVIKNIGCDNCRAKDRAKTKGVLNVKHGLRKHPLYSTYYNEVRYRKTCPEWIGENGFINFYNWAISRWEKGLRLKLEYGKDVYSPETVSFVRPEDIVHYKKTALFKEKRNVVARRKWNEDTLAALSGKLSLRTRKAFAAIKKKKPYKTKELLGADWDVIKKHIETQFEPWMNWSNNKPYVKGGERVWHIDHIISLASAKTVEELMVLCKYTNLRPLEGFQNISDGNRGKRK
jgi:hypothetical protein